MAKADLPRAADRPSQPRAPHEPWSPHHGSCASPSSDLLAIGDQHTADRSL